MKTIKEVSDFCITFTSYDHYRNEIVIELNKVGEFKISMLSKCDQIDENL